MKHKGLNDNKITVEAGISNGLIGKARKRGSLSQDNISKILHTYPEFNAHWWFTGKGEMILSEMSYKNSQVTEGVSEETVIYDKFKVLKELFGSDKKLDTIIEMLGSKFNNIEDRLDQLALLTKVDSIIEEEKKN